LQVLRHNRVGVEIIFLLKEKLASLEDFEFDPEKGPSATAFEMGL
jgi:hypothetical protein